jgi:hypothetical protein
MSPRAEPDSKGLVVDDSREPSCQGRKHADRKAGLAVIVVPATFHPGCPLSKGVSLARSATSGILVADRAAISGRNDDHSRRAGL